jgi:hypothetical protein
MSFQYTFNQFYGSFTCDECHQMISTLNYSAFLDPRDSTAPVAPRHFCHSQHHCHQKIVELERDRPLWEAAARARERQEREEEEERRAAHERRKREETEALARAEEERRVEAERERERVRQAEAEAKARAEAEAAAKRRAEAQRARWARGPWTSQRALERYRVLCESFEEVAKPPSLSFEDIPWPSLSAPFTFGPFLQA